jgi:hypothetical protein
MRRTLAVALRVASVPIGVGAGVWTALLRVDISAQVCGHFLCAVFGTPFARWQSDLVGAGATIVVLLLSWAVSPHMTLSLRDVLRIASVVVGVGVGLSTAVMTSYPSCYPNGCPGFPTHPTFALYQCALFGAGATAVLVLVSFGIRRPASSPYQGDF